MGKIATPQDVTFGRELRGNSWFVVMHIHDGGTLSFPTDAAHEFCRKIMHQVSEIDKVTKGNGRPWPIPYRSRD